MAAPAINLNNTFNARMMASRARMPHRLPSLARASLAGRSFDCLKRLQKFGDKFSLAAVSLCARRLPSLIIDHPSHGTRLEVIYWEELQIILNEAEKTGWIKGFHDQKIMELTRWLANVDNFLSRGVTPDNMFSSADALCAKAASFKKDIPIVSVGMSEQERPMIPFAIKQARKLIAYVSPEQDRDIDNYVSSIGVGPRRSSGLSGSSFECFDFIHIYLDLEEDVIMRIANTLVHETAHVKFSLGYAHLIMFGFFHRGDICQRGRQQLAELQVLSRDAAERYAPLLLFNEIDAYLAGLRFTTYLLKHLMAERCLEGIADIDYYRRYDADTIRSLFQIAQEDLTLTDLGRAYLERQRGLFYDIFSL